MLSDGTLKGNTPGGWDGAGEPIPAFGVIP